jgi:hypothetical protein
MSALGTSCQARNNANKEANAARDKEGQAGAFAKILIPLPGLCLRDHEVPDRVVHTARCFKPIENYGGWAEAARDNEKDGPVSTTAKKRAQLQSALAKIESTFDKEKDGPESKIAKKRAKLQTSLANFEIMVYNRTQKQIELNERERRYARLRVEAAKDLQVRSTAYHHGYSRCNFCLM